uniref:Uncharacterized protein n=1 Tax=Anguilla anguilla TaxID=7936 RepID=A0A0E9RTT8_ANGAN
MHRLNYLSVLHHHHLCISIFSILRCFIFCLFFFLYFIPVLVYWS